MAAGRGKDRYTGGGGNGDGLRDGIRKISHGNRRMQPPLVVEGYRPGGLLVPIKPHPSGLRSSIERSGVYGERDHPQTIQRSTKHRPQSRRGTSRNQENRRITMLNFHSVFYAITLLVAIVLVGKCYTHPSLRQRPDVRPLCLGCGNECDKCEFGHTISSLCGIRECRRGPGDLCGGPSEAWGVCGEGLRCSCNRCSGCSLDSLTCFENPCLPHQNPGFGARSHLEALSEFPFDRVK